MAQRPAAETNGNQIQLSEDLIESYLLAMRKKKVSADTYRQYEQRLWRFYNDLPADKHLDQTTMQQWRNRLKRTYAAETVNTYVMVVNGLLEWLGRRDLQILERFRKVRSAQPELTREEYRRLLQTAKNLGNEKAYCLVKLFATTGMAVQEVLKLTVQDVKDGEIVERRGQTRKRVRLPHCLQEELLAFAEHEGIRSGTLFRASRSSVLTRSRINWFIQELCQDSRVPAEKATPRCLQKLYQEAQAALEQDLRILVDQAHEQMLEEEQKIVGWKEPSDPA